MYALTMRREIVSRGRPPLPDDELAQLSYSVKISKWMRDRLRENKRTSRIGIVDQIELALEQYLVRSEEADNPNRILFTVEEDERKKLEEIAPVAYQRTATGLVEALTRAAVSHGPNAVRKFLLNDNSTSATIEASALTAEEIEAGKRSTRIKNEAAKVREELNERSRTKRAA